MENHTDTDNNTPRPFGYWLRAVDGLIAREFAAAFEAEGVTRRDWRVLNLLAGDVVAPELTARLERHGGKKLRGMVERGWVAEADGAWTLTDEGRVAQARLGEIVTGIRTKVAGAVSDDDFATTLASLEKIARELGWNPDERMPRGFGRRGFGRGGRGHGRPAFRRGFGREGFGPRFGGEGFGPGFAGRDAGRGFGREAFGPRGERPEFHGDHGDHGADCAHGRGHGRRHGAHAHAERAYERGFDAGFTRGTAGHEA
jgi:hypothetical protein